MRQLAIILGVALLGIGAFAQPQGRQSAEDRAKSQTERLKTELTLSADQEKKVYELYLASGKKMEEMRKSSQGDREAMRTKMEGSRSEQDTKLKTILSADQFKKYQELQKKLDAERQQRRANAPSGGRQQ